MVPPPGYIRLAKVSLSLPNTAVTASLKLRFLVETVARYIETKHLHPARLFLVCQVYCTTDSDPQYFSLRVAGGATSRPIHLKVAAHKRIVPPWPLRYEVSNRSKQVSGSISKRHSWKSYRPTESNLGRGRGGCLGAGGSSSSRKHALDSTSKTHGRGARSRPCERSIACLLVWTSSIATVVGFIVHTCTQLCDEAMLVHMWKFYSMQTHVDYRRAVLCRRCGFSKCVDSTVKCGVFFNPLPVTARGRG